jgi:AraC-like DNA-binding protein
MCARVRPDQAGPYDARLTLVRLGGVNLAMSQESLPRRFLCDVRPDRVFFRLKHHDETPGIRNGLAELAGTVHINRRGTTLDERTAGRLVWRSISMPFSDLAARAETLAGRSVLSLLGERERMRPEPLAFARMCLLQRDALRLATENPAALGHPVAAAALDARLGESLVAMLATAAPKADSRARLHGHAIVRRVLACIEANETHPITLAELCAAGQCCAKTLVNLFHETFGRTPIIYLRQLRLRQARRALLAADPRETTVSSVALDCGFWELGRFAAAYRRMFGESPSRTLRSEARAAGAWVRAV